MQTEPTDAKFKVIRPKRKWRLYFAPETPWIMLGAGLIAAVHWLGRGLH